MAKASFVWSIGGIRTAATTDDLTLTRVTKPVLICIDRLSAVCVDHAATLITFGFKRGSDEVLLYSVAPSAANQVVTMPERIFVTSDYAPFARFLGGTAGDKLMFYAYGYMGTTLE